MTEKMPPRVRSRGPARAPGRVHWMELFFDLVFVAFVGQLAHGIHGNPGWAEFGTFVLLFFPAWWAWVNIVSVVNLLPGLSSRSLGMAMLAAMAAAGVMAAAAPHALGGRAWAFSLANAAMRAILLVLWLYRRRHTGGAAPSWRIWTYNGGTAALWLVAAALPLEGAVALWAAAILVEVSMVLVGGRLQPDAGIAGINVEHAAERLGLFVIIVLGESVFTVVTVVSTVWNPAAWLAGSLGFVVVALLGWAFFQYGTGTLNAGLERLAGRRDFGGIQLTILFMPFLLVAGVTAIAGAIATAIPAPFATLPLGSGITLGGGLALFYLTNAVVSLRFGQSAGAVLPWSIPAVALSLLLVPASRAVPAAVVLGLAVVLLLALTAYVELHHRAMARQG
ncbi:low temperature requirement protein A [Arthrobacter sp. STN4]|uniref:low temperature requirement protein A n=1 Tax=Arthrobacter sp. STN4 TaxID=2923276 RepID=UPI00211A307C|nr:low temperature requirement protein A [Arthrobacter sp. STN4]MCQ9165025.1 low temperature requirement protein A [Arthrobacter sp. STN4]